MRRMYFVMDSTESARRVTEELLLDKIPQHRIHVIKQDEELPEDLPEATPDEASDFWPALFKGLGIGAVTGLLVGVLLAATGLFGVTFEMLSGTPILGFLAILGGLMGAFGAAIVGISVPNPMLERFQQSLNDGQVLLMADVPSERVDEVRNDIQQTEPKAEYYGLEPLKPAFP